jgi:enoyl-[acyl-carrier protein] reductase I
MLLKGKKGLITGVANSSSIAWAIAKMASEHGAEIALSYNGEVLRKRVYPLAETIGCQRIYHTDFANQDSADAMFDSLEKDWGELDFALHSIVFAHKEDLTGRYLDTPADNFKDCLNISCYSLNTLVRGAEKLMKNGGSIVTLTYLGASKVVPSYNVMGVAKAALEAGVRYIASEVGQKGIRVNSISAGPVKTLASSAVRGFNHMIRKMPAVAPLRRNITTQDVAGAALYFFSNLSAGVTGENHYVDSGYNTMGFLDDIENVDQE